MKCIQCGCGMKARCENHSYKASGLTGVTLVGVEVRRCPRCGEWEVSIPRIAQLNQAVALALARKPTMLNGPEIRFLRKNLGWSGIDFAVYMGVTPETVSRWERGHLQMGPTADRLLRMLVAYLEPVNRYPLETLKTIRKERQPKLKLEMHMGRGGWAAA